MALRRCLTFGDYMNMNRKLERKIEKYKAFFADDTPGQIVASISPYTFHIDYGEHMVKPLNQWDFERDVEQFVEAGVASLRHFMDVTKDLEDDFIPAYTPGFGTGVNSAVVSGMPVTFGVDTSWTNHIIETWEDLNKLRLDRSNPWVKVLERACAKSAALCDGDYVVGTYSHFAPSDMANALRGNQIFYDIYDHPDQVARLLDFCADATIWLEKILRETAPKYMGGRHAAYMWFEGECCYLSEDNADLCAPDFYTELYGPATQKVLNELGGAYIHHHAKGRHIHKEIAKLHGLRAVELSWDPGCPRPIDMLEEVLEWTGNVVLQTRCTAADVYKYIDILKKGRVSLMIDVTSLQEAKDVLSFIHKHSKI